MSNTILSYLPYSLTILNKGVKKNVERNIENEMDTQQIHVVNMKEWTTKVVAWASNKLMRSQKVEGTLGQMQQGVDTSRDLISGASKQNCQLEEEEDETTKIGAGDGNESINLVTS